MPVTVKFSEKFYDRLGHEMVDELVNHLNAVDANYRNELRELNELNFARFDDKLERRVTQLEATIDKRTAQLDVRIDQLTARLDAKLEALETRLIRWMFVFVTTGVIAILGLS